MFGIAIKYSVMVVPRAFAARLIQNAPDDAIPPQTVATLHVLLLFESTLPRSYVLIGLVTHGSYYRLLKDFPVVQGSTNPWLISSIVLLHSRLELPNSLNFISTFEVRNPTVEISSK